MSDSTNAPATHDGGSATSLSRRVGWARLGRARTGWALGVVLTVVIVLIALVAGWTLRALLAPAPDVVGSQDYTIIAAQQQTVSQTIQLQTTARWAATSTVRSQATGVVTSVDLDEGAAATHGDVLFTVDLRPVVVAEGDVPAFRDLSRGDDGEDVTQLQELLTQTGHYTGAVDGHFGTGLYWAVRAWQRDHGLAQDGRVRRGDLVFVPRLPARLAPGEGLEVGATGGGHAVRVLEDSPQFTIALPEGQARMVDAGMAVDIHPPEGETWRATVDEIRRQESGETEAVLTGTDDEPICGDACEDVPVSEEVLLPSEIQVVPEVSGVTVPVPAVVTDADGDTVVVHASGERQPVTVVASASGDAVVEGLAAGTRVRVPGDGLTDDRARR